MSKSHATQAQLIEHSILRRLRRMLAVMAFVSLAAQQVFANETGTSEDITDPTAPPKALDSPETSLHLSAVLIKDGQAHARINGQLVGVGDQIGGATLLAIESSRVEIDRDGQHEWLNLFHPMNIKMSTNGSAQPAQQEK